MPKALDITGRRFGNLVAVSKADSQYVGKKLRTYWLCRCDCGNTKVVRTDSLLIGDIKTCGHVDDWVGRQFGRLVVIAYAGHYFRGKNVANRVAYWFAQCSCDKTILVTGNDLQTGKTKSCGCLAEEHKTNFVADHITHNLTNHRLYSIYSGIKNRCYNTKDNRYYSYGAKGIVVCDEWLNSFQSFFDWAICNGYSDSLSIDRINVNGNYEPSNCRWSTPVEQARNTSKNRLINYNGEIRCLAEWSEKTGIPQSTIYNRMLRGLSLDLVFSNCRLTPQKYSYIEGI